MNKSSEIEIYTNHNCCAKTLKGKDCKRERVNNGYYCNIHYKDFYSPFEKPEDCLICTEELGDKDNLLSCGHWMHRSCFIKTHKETCPVCRKKVKLSIEEKKKIREENRRDLDEEENLRNFLISLINDINNPNLETTISFPLEDFEIVEFIHNLMNSS